MKRHNKIDKGMRSLKRKIRSAASRVERIISSSTSTSPPFYSPLISEVDTPMNSKGGKEQNPNKPRRSRPVLQWPREPDLNDPLDCTRACLEEIKFHFIYWSKLLVYGVCTNAPFIGDKIDKGTSSLQRKIHSGVRRVPSSTTSSTSPNFYSPQSSKVDTPMKSKEGKELNSNKPRRSRPVLKWPREPDLDDPLDCTRACLEEIKFHFIYWSKLLVYGVCTNAPFIGDKIDKGTSSLQKKIHSGVRRVLSSTTSSTSPNFYSPQSSEVDTPMKSKEGKEQNSSKPRRSRPVLKWPREPDLDDPLDCTRACLEEIKFHFIYWSKLLVYGFCTHAPAIEDKIVETTSRLRRRFRSAASGVARIISYTTSTSLRFHSPLISEVGTSMKSNGGKGHMAEDKKHVMYEGSFEIAGRTVIFMVI